MFLTLKQALHWPPDEPDLANVADLTPLKPPKPCCQTLAVCDPQRVPSDGARTGVRSRLELWSDRGDTLSGYREIYARSGGRHFEI